MSQQLQITGGAKVRDLQDVIIGTSGVLSSLAFNVANGVPKLDVNGKILVSQLPNSVMEYQGTWNAATNTPTLVNGTGNQGDVYLCNVAGTTNFGAGPITFAVGDSAIYSGTIWQRAGGATGTVTSVGLTSTGNDAITITGSPITTSGNINLGFAGTNLQYINGAGDLTNFPTLITSIGLSMPSAFNVSNSPLTANGTIAVTGAGYPSQYIRGDGTLADFPTSGGGGSSVSYYLNGGTSQGTIGGVTYYEMSKTADTGTGVDFNKTGNGLIVSFLTDAGDPAQLNIPAGNWNYEIYASMSSNGGTPQLYAELYVYDGTTFTLISTSSNEILYDGVNLNLYTFAMAVPATTLALTDRLAVKLYATNSGGKTTTIHTQDSHLCQIITTFSTGITALNGLTAQVQYFATGTSGTDFNISSTTATHTFNIPSASATNRGLITTGSQTIAGDKTFSGSIILNGGVDMNNSLNVNSGFFIRNNVIGSTLYTSFSINKASNIETVQFLYSTGFASNLLFNDAATYSYSFPTASGTIALTSNLSSYVPYTGATANVDLGTFNLSTLGTLLSKYVYVGGNGTNSGFLSFSQYATPDLSGTNATSIYTTSNNKVNFRFWQSGVSYKTFNFDVTSLTTGTERTFTLPDATGTLAILEAGTQTFTGTVNVLGSLGTKFGISIEKGNTPSPLSFNDIFIYASSGATSIINFANSSYRTSFSFPTSNQTFTFPSATGTVALTSDITSAISGTTNYHAKFTGTSTIGNSLIWDNGTNVGIGNTNTSYTLDVSGTLRTTGAATFNAALVSQGGYTGFQYNSAGAYPAYNTYFGAIGTNFSNSNSELDIWNTVGGGFVFRKQTAASTQTALMTITSAGNVGIGTSSPSSYSSPANQLVVGTNSGNNGITIAGGTTGLSSIYFADGTTGNEAYRGYFEYGHTSDYMAFGTAASERMRITSGGNVLINNTSSVGSKLIVKADGTSNAGYAAIFWDSTSNDLFYLRNDGLVATGTRTFSPYNYAASGRAMIVDASGFVGYLVSTRESKANIKSIENVDFINQLNPVSFNYRKKDNKTNEFTDEVYKNTTYGFIADEVEKINKELVFYNEDGTLAGVEYNNMIAILTKAVQELKAEIDILKNK